MEMTRGKFLKSLAVGAGTVLSGLAAVDAHDFRTRDGAEGTGSALSPLDRIRQMTERLNQAAFTRNLNTKFRILDKSSPVVIEAELVEVEEKSTSRKLEQFSILFIGPAEPCLPQSTYEIEHREMGNFDLFLVPIASDKNGTSYEAVFSRTRF